MATLAEKKKEYLEQAELLTRKPSVIERQWSTGEGMFQFCSSTGEYTLAPGCGCLTQVKKGGYFVPGRDDLTKLIREADLPMLASEIRSVHFPKMMELQLLLDKEIRGIKE